MTFPPGPYTYRTPGINGACFADIDRPKHAAFVSVVIRIDGTKTEIPGAMELVRAIAALPELVEAAQKAEGLLTDFDHNGDGPRVYVREVISALSAALAKMEGK